jgi:hypothetical protein
VKVPVVGQDGFVPGGALGFAVPAAGALTVMATITPTTIAPTTMPPIIADPGFCLVDSSKVQRQGPHLDG